MVVVIIGVIAGAATLAIGGSGSRELENAARRAEVRVNLACERAAFTGQDIGFSLLDGALRFGYLLPERWMPLADSADEALRERPLGDGLSLLLLRDGLEVIGDRESLQPQFVCFSSGELTPFELVLARAGVPERWRLVAGVNGTIELNRVDPR